MRLSNIVLNTKKKVEVAVVDKEGNTGTETGKDVKPKTETVVKTEEELDYLLYKVRYIPARRDCLWRISSKFYTDPHKWKDIYKENRDKIKNPDLIWPNMILKIPKVKKSKIKEEGVVPQENKEPIKQEPQKEKINEETAPQENVK